jgi:nitrogen fixation protein FixH
MFMKKTCNVLIVLLITLFVFSSFASFYRILPTAKATYVEGAITQDTDWTLVDSPFIVSNDITVNPGATLTIEPGVQVRFADNFSMTVNGRIIADGTNDRPILFTSNNLNASVGKWGTIIIDGIPESSITNCIIEYGTNGTTFESGSLNFQNNIVRSNQNGIVVNGGSATIENNEITNNTASGIVLTGSLTGNINIAQNNIYLNNDTGISLEASAYLNTAIVQNNVFLNGYGFHVTTNASTYITRNYISNNTNGIFYEKGNGHEAHFNDIYNNTMGIDVSSVNLDENCVNATYNYWGDESGPFHSSLNPYGKGNTVGGNGVTLDFIFFLSKPIDYDNTAPTAILQTDKTLVAPNQNVTFIGTNSYDDGRVDQYFYDFGDGANSGWTTLTLFNHTYSTVGTYIASLKVIDDFDSTSQNTATSIITVQNLTPLNVAMSLISQVADYNGNITVTVYVSNAAGGMENAAVTLLALKGGSFLPASGVTDQTGYFSTTFTAPNFTDVSYIRLIATASEAGYADGSCHENLKVLPMLHTQLSTDPATVKSEATVAAVFHVTNGLGQPIIDASLTTTADNGTLSAGTGFTDTGGSLTLNFTAPYTLSPMNVTITATATKSEYADTVSQSIITIEPKVLTAQVTTENSAALSEDNITVNVRVTYDTAPEQDANVTLASDSGGNFSQPTAVTDSNGTSTFVFTAPPANVPLNATITAQASKIGYVDGQDSSIISVSPRNMTVQIQVSSYAIESSSTAIVAVNVTSNATPVADAQVTLTANFGNFSATTGPTDSNGTCTFTFNAPSTTVQLPVVISANVTKNGYFGNGNQTTINVIPVAPTQNEGGFPWVTMLLIIIPVAIAVIVLVLIKLKVIVVSAGEEESATE